jgi:hypothetical protein
MVLGLDCVGMEGAGNDDPSEQRFLRSHARDPVPAISNRILSARGNSRITAPSDQWRDTASVLRIARHRKVAEI